MRNLKKAILCSLFFLLAGQIYAQFQVNLQIKRRLYIRYEPLIVTVTITNRTGRDAVLEDAKNQPWFGFNITNNSGSPVPPNNMDYTLRPLEIAAGETLVRNINVTPIYSLHDFGMYKLRAYIYEKETDKYFVSNYQSIDITDGRVTWTQNVGHPDDGSLRKVSLLSHRLPQGDRVYIRIENPDSGVIYATIKLGRLLAYAKPLVAFDRSNEIHVLQKISPAQYLYTHLGLNGELRERGSYVAIGKNVPRLSRASTGRITVKGGEISAPIAESIENPQPRISDRPEGIPGD